MLSADKGPVPGIQEEWVQPVLLAGMHCNGGSEVAFGVTLV